METTTKDKDKSEEVVAALVAIKDLIDGIDEGSALTEYSVTIQSKGFKAQSRWKQFATESVIFCTIGFFITVSGMLVLGLL